MHAMVWPEVWPEWALPYSPGLLFLSLATGSAVCLRDALVARSKLTRWDVVERLAFAVMTWLLLANWLLRLLDRQYVWFDILALFGILAWMVMILVDERIRRRRDRDSGSEGPGHGPRWLPRGPRR